MTFDQTVLPEFYAKASNFINQLGLYRSKVYELYAHKLKPDQLSDEKPVILVIEDNSDEWFLIRWALLQRFPNTEFAWLSTEDQVIPYLDTRTRQEQGLPKLILLDLYLPSKWDGLQVLHSLKGHHLYQQIPTITISRSSNQQDIVEVLYLSCKSYIVKPDDYNDWKETFKELYTYWQEPC